jgi:hypothetical protein
MAYSSWAVIAVINADGSGRRTVLHAIGDWPTPQWTADGRILFSSSTGNGRRIFIADSTGTPRQLIPDDATAARAGYSDTQATWAR